MKFIYLADTHIKGKNPENRIGNYYQDVMTKVKEVIKLSKKLKVNYVIHGGDVFNSPFYEKECPLNEEKKWIKNIR